MKKYQIIYADPPWPNTRNDGNRAACKKFPLMCMTDILNLNVASISGNPCILFLWCPTIFLQEALDTIKCWGFVYKTMGFVWVKTTKIGSPAWGLGGYTRSNAEFCLIGVKNKLKVVSHSVHQIVLEPRRRFAQKPDVVRDRIVTLMGDLPRIELFARQKTEGWDCWGNEVDSSIQLTTKEDEK